MLGRFHHSGASSDDDRDFEDDECEGADEDEQGADIDEKRRLFDIPGQQELSQADERSSDEHPWISPPAGTALCTGDHR